MLGMVVVSSSSWLEWRNNDVGVSLLGGCWWWWWSVEESRDNISEALRLSADVVDVVVVFLCGSSSFSSFSSSPSSDGLDVAFLLVERVRSSSDSSSCSLSGRTMGLLDLDVVGAFEEAVFVFGVAFVGTEG